MNAIVLSNFDDIDLAEIAARRLKSDVSGISHIEISQPNFEEPQERMILPTVMAGETASIGVGPVSNGVFPVFMNLDRPEEQPGSSDYIPHGVTLRVTCKQAQREAVEAKLINLGGRHIRSFKEPQI